MSNIAKALIMDSLGRTANYLRISITDRCNLDCLYCRNGGKQIYIPHENILRYEHLLRLAFIASRLGIKKMRITGGEPFARKDCMAFLLRLRDKLPGMALAITTNGTLIEPFVLDLAKAGLASVNISLDSFDRQTFARLSGHDCLAAVLNNIDRLIAAGVMVKINVVAIRGVTDRQIGDFIHAAKNMPVDVRFIEFMPMGSNTLWSPELFLETSRIFQLVSQKTALEPCGQSESTAGPARMWKLAGGKGRIGFISAISHHFCHKCNRLRLTSAGRLRTCLFSDREYDIGRLLRHPHISDAAIARAIKAAARGKPLGADLLLIKRQTSVAMRPMTGIGG